MRTPLARYLRGPYHFLHGTEEEILRLFPETVSSLPIPQRIFLEDETATPLVGFPVLLNEPMRNLQRALQSYLQAEEMAQVAIRRRKPYDRSAPGNAWENYRGLLTRAVEYSTLSSFGRRFPSIFWLYHSTTVAQWLKETPRRVVRQDLEVGRQHGERIKYRIFERYIDQVLSSTYDTVHQIAGRFAETEEELFPKLLSRMFDNVLIFTEDRLTSDLSDLKGYFSGYLRLDPKDWQQRMQRLSEWTERAVHSDPALTSVVKNLLGTTPELSARQLFTHPGFVQHLSNCQGYDPELLLPPDQVAVWESLLIKLKEFELLNELRQAILPAQPEGDTLVFRAGGLDRTWSGKRFIQLSQTTRPLDFTAPWILDPRVQRFGLVYDISEFSQVVSMLRRAGYETQDRSFRMLFRFQRQINRLAGSYRLKLEKYLGDGAFFTGRFALRLLLCAVQLQRLYRTAVDQGFPFNRGMRVGINFGTYRLIPIETVSRDGVERYEFFGHGVVELSRLTTGKTTDDVEEVKTMLISRGYPRSAVLRFFEPLSQTNLDVVDKTQQERAFYAYVNRNGTLINEGIVATGELIRKLDDELQPSAYYQTQIAGHGYVVISLPDTEGALDIGIRKLGSVQLKGLDSLTVYELVDGMDLAEATRAPLEADDLISAMDQQFANDRGLSRR